VVSTAVALWPGTGAVLEGLLLPSIPEGGLDWTLALMGGVGGTVTVLCYGYWLREENRGGQGALWTSRIDLAAAYLVTALFGVAMVIIGSTVEIEGRGAGLLVTLSARLAETLGPAAGTLFLVGALGAVFSSLLGVWQAVPYLFADLWGQLLGTHGPGGAALDDAVDTRGLPYRGYLTALALLPMAGLFHSFREVQKVYALAGAWFLPVLALALLFLNGRAGWVGPRYRSRPATQAVLLATLAFFSWIAWRAMRQG
jgi:Mn2+/Fe2+ NRAMP family transporter